MANVGQSTPSTRDSDLPDPCGEKRELRRMVQELEAENERLRGALREVVREAEFLYTDVKHLRREAPTENVHDRITDTLTRVSDLNAPGPPIFAIIDANDVSVVLNEDVMLGACDRAEGRSS